MKFDPQLDPSHGSYSASYRLTLWVAANFPSRFSLMLGLGLITQLLENVGLVLLVPLFDLVTKSNSVTGSSKVAAKFIEVFQLFHIPFSIGAVLITMCLLIYGKSILILWISVLRNNFFMDIASDTRMRLVTSMMNSSWSYAKLISPGKFISLTSMEINRLSIAINLVVQLCLSIIAAFVYFGVAMALQWMVVVCAALVGILSLVVVRRFLQSSYDTGFAITNSLSALNHIIVQSIGGLKILKAMNYQGKTVELIQHRSDDYLDSQNSQLLSGLTIKNTQEPIAITLLASLLFIGNVMFDIDVVLLGVVILVIIRLSSTVSNIQQSIQQIGSVGGSVAQVFDAIHTADEACEDLHPDQKKVTFQREINIEGATFAYEDRTVLTNVSLSIPNHGLTVLTGPSGGGKTTIIDGILRFNPCINGRITLDGTDIRDMDIGFWRSQIGYLPQEVFLFSDTIRSNVTLGDTSISDGDVIRALRRAEIWDYIETCPGQLDYQVAEGGTKLSGGQRQRIALARALVRDARLLVLDEATSALDEINRRKIIDTIAKLKQSIAVLAITHDNDLLRSADWSYLIEGGAVRPLHERQLAVAAN